MRPQYRDTADHDALRGIEPEPECPPVELCTFHGEWIYHFPTIDECPKCAIARDELARADAEWDHRTSYPRYR